MMAAAAPGRRARASPPAASLSLSMHLGGRSGFQVLVHWQLDSRRRLSLVAWRRGPARRRRPRADGRGRGIPLAVPGQLAAAVSEPARPEWRPWLPGGPQAALEADSDPGSPAGTRAGPLPLTRAAPARAPSPCWAVTVAQCYS
jgi:hypothetical protein